MNGRIRLMVVEDHPIFLRGLTGLLALEPGLEVVAEAPNRALALEAFDRLGPEAAVVDLSLGEDHGLDLIKDLVHRDPGLRVLVLSMFDEAVYAPRAQAAGALGFCSKREPTAVLLDAIRTVASGRRWHSPSSPDAPPAEALVAPLSDRELAVFRLVGIGLGSTEVADRLCLSVKTVDTYKRQIREKLGCPGAPDLRRAAVDWVSREHRL